MSRMRPKCYGCDRDAAAGRMFCTDRCAAGYVEELVRGNEEQWCPLCEKWSSPSMGMDIMNCNHVQTGITEGMPRKDAAALYNAAIERAKATGT